MRRHNVHHPKLPHHWIELVTSHTIIIRSLSLAGHCSTQHTASHTHPNSAVCKRPSVEVKGKSNALALHQTQMPNTQSKPTNGKPPRPGKCLFTKWGHSHYHKLQLGKRRGHGGGKRKIPCPSTVPNQNTPTNLHCVVVSVSSLPLLYIHILLEAW